MAKLLLSPQMLLRWDNPHRHTKTAGDSRAPGVWGGDESASRCHAPRAGCETHCGPRLRNGPDTGNRYSALSVEYAVFPPRLLAGRRTNPPRLSAAQRFLATARAEKAPRLRTSHPCGHSSRASPYGVSLYLLHTPPS